jgi:hypothetical protein
MFSADNIITSSTVVQMVTAERFSALSTVGCVSFAIEGPIGCTSNRVVLAQGIATDVAFDDMVRTARLVAFITRLAVCWAEVVVTLTTFFEVRRTNYFATLPTVGRVTGTTRVPAVSAGRHMGGAQFITTLATGCTVRGA